ncbi:MAG: hypothetical protein QOE75_858 [Solirubrobacterales bacterium]|jgi:ABC-type phosphate transport system auxiliary subunit|nr:hypothetical protein [Solirubrobacterales bacterium]
MELMTWTDARLEERFAHIDTRFDRLEAVVAVKAETREVRKEVERLTAEVQALRDEMREEFRALHLMMHRDRQGIIVALVALLAAIIVKGA